MTATIRQVFADHAAVIEQAAIDLPPIIEQIVDLVHRCLREGRKVMACGNGGSASDAQHLVAELVGRFRDERRALAAVTLMADSATLTAVANDYGYEQVFARQVEAIGVAGDVLIAISTSGNSANVLRAAAVARATGCAVVALTGAGGGKLAGHADHCVRAPSDVVARIQEVHALCIHAIADALDARIISAVRP
jgi:D-sedoheptulose 7-phosphate isomerase